MKYLRYITQVAIGIQDARLGKLIRKKGHVLRKRNKSKVIKPISIGQNWDMVETYIPKNAQYKETYTLVIRPITKRKINAWGFVDQ